MQMSFAYYQPPPYIDFIDLCSVTNISVIIFNEDLNGYYIHGKSPMGAADVTSLQLRLNLEKEAMGNANIRGMHNSPALCEKQTFELFVSKRLI